MELRHLRYFIAVTEAGSLTVAADVLQTAQPSLSRQIRDLEAEVGAELLTRSVRGIELTAAGRAFLGHARRAVAEADEASQAARRAARSTKSTFAIGFLTGLEVDWLPIAMRWLNDRLGEVDVTVSSGYSPMLAKALLNGGIDAAFMRREADMPDLEFDFVKAESLIVVLAHDHRLAAQATIAPEHLDGEFMLGMSRTAPTLKLVIDDYVKRLQLNVPIVHLIDNLAMAMSLAASTNTFVLLPEYASRFLPSSVTSRALVGDVPTIDLVMGYKRADDSPLLAFFRECVKAEARAYL